MNFRIIACLTTALFALGLGNATSATFVISQNNSNALFAPTTRGQAGSTWFGWGFGAFSGTTYTSSSTGAQYKLVNGTANLGPSDTTYRGSISQDNNEYKLTSSTNNIYPLTLSGSNPNGYPTDDYYAASITINVPINVSLENTGTGYTTIIVQGNSSTSAFPTSSSPTGRPPQFLSLDGLSYAPMVFGVNNSTVNAADGGIGNGQFWVKYEIFGSASSYDISFLAGKSGNVAGLTVDSYWSATGFSPDTAVAVPEPSSTALALGGLVVMGWLYKRRRAAQTA